MSSEPIATNTEAESPIWDVIVIGAGIAGVSAVHHLVLATTTTTTLSGTENSPIQILVIDAGPSPGEGVGDRKSGSATMTRTSNPPDHPGESGAAATSTAPTTSRLSRIKMMNQIYECSSEDFVRHHGIEGARRYMQASKTGLELQKELAKELGADLLSELGTYFVCSPEEQDELRAEYEFFKSLGDCCQDLDFVDTMDQVPGASMDFPFGIHFPHDAVIDSSEYAKRLLDRAVTTTSSSSSLSSRGGVTTRFNTRVVQFQDGPDRCTVTLDNGETCQTHHVVVATGAMDPLPQLHGLLWPCYSYLVLVPLPSSSTSSDRTTAVQQSANFFNWNFCHDWCFDQGMVRVSGEDRYSAYKDPHVTERCGRMIDWVYDRYHCSDDPTQQQRLSHDQIHQQYGIYSETPDFVPLVGTRSTESRICYLVGCNATGQTILSYAASLVPHLLGYGGDELEESQKEALRLFSIRRFTQLPPE